MSGWLGQPQCLYCGKQFDPFRPFRNFCSEECEKKFIKYLEEEEKEYLDETQEESK